MGVRQLQTVLEMFDKKRRFVGEIFAHNKRDLLGYLRRRVGPDDASDLLQEVACPTPAPAGKRRPCGDAAKAKPSKASNHARIPAIPAWVKLHRPGASFTMRERDRLGSTG
jgi:hypothetical protein